MNHKSVGLCLVMALFCLTVGHPAGQPTPGPAIDVEKLGPQVGETVPDFTLPDQYGAARSLTSLMGPKGAILVFFRSADW